MATSKTEKDCGSLAATRLGAPTVTLRNGHAVGGVLVPSIIITVPEIISR